MVSKGSRGRACFGGLRSDLGSGVASEKSSLKKCIWFQRAFVVELVLVV